ncbi:MAG: UDP-2,3-diacylglucosamine diphosphatase [Pseudomonadota bacterium]|nr:UDP-2,3-diacylglucosamine diphosphatase [Pseudomonadota bacterium]
MRTLLISDLHLEDQRPDITRALFHLLDRFEGKLDQLFILGDFFEIWLGDDALTTTATEVARRLHKFSHAGAAVFIMHGNRDFLIGEQYAEACGAQLIHEPYLTDIAGRPTLLMHGDTLCTDDVLYMDFRKMVRNPEWQAAFLSKPLADRIAFGKQARSQSQADAKDKSYEILDVNPEEVEQVCSQYQVPLFIHGHTHRPARHQVELKDARCERIVLGDWHAKGWYLLAEENTLELRSFEFTEVPA